jgi:hypothetical protein
MSVENTGVEGTEINFEVIVLRFLQACQQIREMGTYIHHVRIHPDLKQGFQAELGRVPEEVLPSAMIAKIQIEEDPSEKEIRIITGKDIERMYLERHFGPREEGGTGVLPNLMNYLQKNKIPVTVDLPFLRTLFLLEAVERIDSRVITASAGALPNLADLRRR